MGSESGGAGVEIAIQVNGLWGLRLQDLAQSGGGGGRGGFKAWSASQPDESLKPTP